MPLPAVTNTITVSVRIVDRCTMDKHLSKIRQTIIIAIRCNWISTRNSLFIITDAIAITVRRVFSQQLTVKVDILEQDISVDISLGHEFAVGIIDEVFAATVRQGFTDTLPKPLY